MTIWQVFYSRAFYKNHSKLLRIPHSCLSQFVWQVDNKKKIKRQGTTGRLDTGWHRIVCDVSVHFFTSTYCSRFSRAAFEQDQNYSGVFHSQTVTGVNEDKKSQVGRREDCIAAVTGHGMLLDESFYLRIPM